MNKPIDNLKALGKFANYVCQADNAGHREMF